MSDRLEDTMENLGSNTSRHDGSLKLAALVLASLVGGCAVEAASPDDEAEPAADVSSEDIGETEQALAESTCGHSICETGAAVPATCDSCVTSICDVDPFCCTNAWDSVCVNEVASVCGRGPLAVTSSTVVSSLKVRIRTGGDDLRGGSQAYGSFQLASGASLPKTSLNGGAGFPNNSVKVATMNFSPSRTLGSLAGFTLEWDGAPRNVFDSYDNWNADEIRFLIEPAGRCPTLLGAPFTPGRMTGSRTIASTSVRFP
ncbi:hypothetical protein [Sorangium sp. So ce1153]|uniref:hypothetical protein n=1 Tax=Sorangium sp. So ce1153 TaxID=3133333 RepID=UPI003F636FEF